MKRQVTMEEISDGKLYTSNDLVKADCGDCEGCHACCTGDGKLNRAGSAGYCPDLQGNRSGF